MPSTKNRKIEKLVGYKGENLRLFPLDWLTEPNFQLILLIFSCLNCLLRWMFADNRWVIAGEANIVMNFRRGVRVETWDEKLEVEGKRKTLFASLIRY